MASYTPSTDELRALLRAVVAAKFVEDPADQDLVASTVLASACDRIIEVIRHHDVLRWGAKAEHNMLTWRFLTPERDEWQLALRLGNHFFSEHWSGWNDERRQLAVAALVSPFKLSEELEKQFTASLVRSFD